MKTKQQRHLLGQALAFLWPMAKRLPGVRIGFILNSLYTALAEVLLPESARLLALAASTSEMRDFYIGVGYQVFTNVIYDVLLALIPIGLVIALVPLGGKLKKRLFDHALALPYTQYAQRAGSEWLFRQQNDAVQIEALITYFLRDGLKALMTGLVMLCYMALLSPVMALIMLALGIVKICIVTTFLPKLYQKVEERQLRAMEMNQAIQSSIFVCADLRAYQREDLALCEFKSRNAALYACQQSVCRQGYRADFFGSLCNVLGNEGAVGVGALLCIPGWLGLPQLYALQTMFYRLFGFCFDDIGELILSLPERLVSYQRYRETLAGEAAAPTPETAPAEGHDALSVDHMSFSYEAEQDPILSHINLNMREGDKLAFTGPSGCGKTTLLRILAGLYAPTEGTVRVWGQNPNTAAENERPIALLSQDFAIYTATIFENIALAAPGLSREQAAECTRRAGLADEIEAMPDGYDTVVGPNGPLSRGQAQRLALARFYAGNARVWLLDEPSASLDPPNEKRLCEELLSVDSTHTVLVATHSAVMLEKLRQCHPIGA